MSETKISPSIVHITDQEQAHLVPTNSEYPVVVTIHDLFHLDPQVLNTAWGPIQIGQKPVHPKDGHSSIDNWASKSRRGFVH